MAEAGGGGVGMEVNVEVNSIESDPWLICNDQWNHEKTKFSQSKSSNAALWFALGAAIFAESEQRERVEVHTTGR